MTEFKKKLTQKVLTKIYKVRLCLFVYITDQQLSIRQSKNKSKETNKITVNYYNMEK